MNTAHLHLMLTHVPVLGTVFGLILLVTGLRKRNEVVKRIALWVFVASALVAVPTYLTGEPSEDIAKTFAGVSKAAIEQHEEAAAFAFGGVIALGTLALLGLALSRGTRVVPGWFALIALVTTLTVSGLMTWTANLGGRIRHLEIQKGTAPPAASGRESRNDEAHEDRGNGALARSAHERGRPVTTV
jgi:uncharacterized membrane protein